VFGIRGIQGVLLARVRELPPSPDKSRAVRALLAAYDADPAVARRVAEGVATDLDRETSSPAGCGEKGRQDEG